MKNWFSIQNKAEQPTEILIYEQIGKDWFTNDGVSAKEFADALSEIPKDKEIVVGINSPGGNVWDGLAIYHLLKARGEKVKTRIDGIAASIASVIALAGSKVMMPDNALMMIHRAWGMAQGNAADMLKLADDLQKHDEVIAGIYSTKNGKSRADNLKAMEEETWFSGIEARAFGLADELTGVVKMANSHNLSQFKNFPAAQSSAHKTDAVGNVPSIHQPDDSAAAISASAVAVADGQLTAAKTNQTKEKNSMPEQTTPAVANPPADFTPIIAAIKDGFASIQNTVTANSLPGAAPVTGNIQNLGNPLVEKYNSLQFDIAARAQLVTNNHREVRNQLLKHGVFNANTVDSNLVNTLTSGTFLTTMRTKMAPLAAFSHQVAVNPVSARQVINVNLLSSAGATQDNPTNFETGDTTSAAKAVTLAHVNRSFYTANSEQDLGLELAQKAPTNARIFAEGIMAKVTALMTNANFGADVVIGAAADFSSTDLPAILALGKNYDMTTLLLDGGHLAYLLPTTRENFTFGEAGAYGFDGGIYKNNLWTSAATDIAGLVCGPDAIIWAAGPPAAGPAGSGLVSSTVTMPEIGLSVTSSTWYALGSRAMWASYDVCFGAAVGDATQAEVLTTA